MLHVDDGQLNALLDGELAPAEMRAVEAHLAGCPDCSRRLDEARAFLAEAGELLSMLVPPAAAAPVQAEPPLVAPLAAGPAPAQPVGPGDVPRAPRLPKTAKEVAVSVDGRTAKTPAIPPVFPHEVPQQPKRRWRLPELEKLAWAASLILAIGVGYLANEVAHLGGRSAPGGRTDLASSDAAPAATVPSSPAPAAPAEERGTAQRRIPSTDLPAASRRDVTGAGGDGAGTRSSVETIAAAAPRQAAVKPPAAAREPDQIAANEPARRQEQRELQAPGAPTAPPAAAPREGAPAQAAPGALGAVSGATPLNRAPAGAGAAGAAPPAAGDRAADSRANRLDEVVVTAVPDDRGRNAFALSASFQQVAMEEAVRRLSGSIRLIDGMNATRVDVGPGRLVTGANPDRDVVRVTYTDPQGQPLVLDQQLGDSRQGAAFNGLLPGDTLVTVSEGGAAQVRWVDRKFWLSLTATAPADSVRVLVERVR